MQMAQRFLRPGILTLCVVGVACGGSTQAPTPPAGPSPPITPPPSNTPLTATVTIGAKGVSPKEVLIGIGGRITFVNEDVQPHDMFSSPHNDHTRPDCPELTRVGFLLPGQSRETSVFEMPRECTFHDHIDPLFEPLIGRITAR
jgi:plastocyanin